MQYTFLSTLLAENKFTLFLVDVSGVLHHDDGVVPGAVEALAWMQTQAPVFLVTNNSCQDPFSISTWLETLGFSIAPDHIISSGLGLSLDPLIHFQLQQKRIYIYGQASSYYYVEKVAYQSIVTDYHQADCIIMTSSHKEASEQEYQALKSFLQIKSLPVICCNPDQYVRGPQGRWIPVVGRYAKRLEEELGIAVQWIGKPYSNYSQVVKIYLQTQFGLTPDTHTCFFDDNPHNVRVLSQDLQIQGCCVIETGITALVLQEDPAALAFKGFSIPRFSL